ncbi:hypothetical protein LSH36_4g18003 [Paralvinella palmiformis]|uniref:Reverse transcriptase domain-containing protein n=1 Tax=Paralvinella palmiformis TaxID=53620 RepID=A0AAD9KFJ5_9ANNE|nr:hypothetical protein LSH36_4g18003 [Paralvinella palmiformis]
MPYSKTLQTLTPDISSNLDIDIHLDNILEAVQLAAYLSVPKPNENKYNRRTNFLPPEEEFDTLAKYFATRAVSHTQPLMIQQELRERHEECSLALQEAIQKESSTDRPFSRYELNNALKAVRITTPGKDTFSNECFINVPQNFLEILFGLYNSSWQQGSLSTKWKQAKVIPITKSGGLSYRPISLLQNISKIMEKRIANRLTWLLPAHQSIFGFVRGKSTTDAIAQLIGDITNGRKI